MRSQKKGCPLFITEILIGFCLGTANIIPGVSGGTFLLIFKIYERVFLILSNINKDNFFKLSSCIFNIIFKPDRVTSFKIFLNFLQKNDFIFFIRLMAGAVVAIFTLSSLMKYLIIYRFSVTYALFFGLILLSIIIPVKMLTDKKLYLIWFVILGAVLTIFVSYSVNPYEKAKTKSDLYEHEYLLNRKVHQKIIDTKAFSFIGKYTPDEYIYAAICGGVAISAMVLPGISGSLVLILMGEYFEVVSAISGLKTLNLDNMVFLGCFAIGIILGGLFFARLFNMVLNRYYNPTMAFLTGLMAGSLYALWPFKKSIVMAHQYIRENGVIHMVQNVRVFTNINQIPAMDSQFYFSLVSFGLGCIIMFFFIGREFQK